MIKLNKTQSAILSRAVENSYGTSTASFAGTGADGGRVRGGQRESQAAHKLADAGLLVRVRSYSHIVYRNGNGTHVYESVWHATDAGREAVKSI